jgi:glycosyltransferase involved in cell wall biosynthesis
VRVRFILAHLERGGPVEHTVTLAGAMASEGVDVGVVCASREVAERVRATGADAVVIPLETWRDGAGARRIWNHVRGCDVVHAQDRRSGLWTRIGPRPGPGGLRVYTVHGLPDEFLPISGGRRRGLRAALAYRGVDAMLCRRADAVVVPSAAFGDLLVARLGFPRSRLVVVHHGVEVPQRPIQPGPDVGTMALLGPVKGLDVLLRAAARLHHQQPDLRFAIMGNGPELGRLRILARQLGLAEAVDFPGYVPKEDALGRLAVFVVSSFFESGPLTLLEAMAAGVPAVAARVGGINEIASEDTAQLVPAGDDAALADAIARLLDDPALRERQALAARERVMNHFTAGDCARSTLDLYRHLLAERR